LWASLNTGFKQSFINFVNLNITMEIKRIRFGKKGVETFLSPLEADVLKAMWELNKAKVRDIYNSLKDRRKVALTSVAVILDRLYEKKLVSREAQTGRGGYHYIYSPSATKSDFEYSLIENTVNKLIDTFGSSAVTYFNERFKNKAENKE